MAQFFQQCLCLFQIRCIKPLGEPAIDLVQYLAHFFFLTLLLPQPRQSYCGSQLPRLCLLLASNCDGLLEGFLWGRNGETGSVRVKRRIGKKERFRSSSPVLPVSGSPVLLTWIPLDSWLLAREIFVLRLRRSRDYAQYERIFLAFSALSRSP